MIDFILGGARSGKSNIAERWAEDSGLAVTYIATAQSKDTEMAQRIQTHQQRRPNAWTTIEEPIELPQALAAHDKANNIILVDCLTLWVSNLLCFGEGELFSDYKQALLRQLKQHQSPVILVSNETGLGVIPMGELSRRFVDESGWLHQEIASLADRVTWVVAGLPQTLKQP